MAISISDLVRSPYELNGNTLEALREHVDECPYDQTARLLLLYNMYQLRDVSYASALHKQAIYLADRNILFRATEGQILGLSTALNTQSPHINKSSNRSVCLIDRFLNSPRAKDLSRTSSIQADPMGDYMAYWAQQHTEKTDEQQTIEDTTKSDQRLNTLLHKAALQPLETETIDDDAITSHTPDPKTQLATPEVKVEVGVKPSTAPTRQVTESDDRESFFTENLAKIYIKQGRYDRAIEILKALSMHNPKKNSYFADQIRFLHKLAINSRFATDALTQTNAT